MGLLFWILLLIGVLIVGVPIVFSLLILRCIKKRNFDKRLRAFAFTPTLTVGYFIYSAFYPSAEFYKEDFKEVTGIELPNNGVILYKTASYPDPFGDYTSISIVKVDKQFYSSLTNQLLSRGFKEKSEEHMGLAEYHKVKERIGDKKIHSEYILLKNGGLSYYVGFLSDEETVIVQRQSW